MKTIQLTLFVCILVVAKVQGRSLRRPLAYTDADILSAPDVDNSPAAVATNFANYPTQVYDPVAFGQRYQGNIFPYPGIDSQPLNYQNEVLPKPASGFDFLVYAPFNVKISTYWISRLGLGNAQRMFREDVGIALWNVAGGIDLMVKVTDVDDNLAINDVVVEPYILKVLQNYQGADPVPPLQNCLWYFTKTWSIAPRPRFQQSLPILQPALINSVSWMYAATEAQWNANIAHLMSINWPGVQAMKYGMIGSTDPAVVNTNFPPDLTAPRITAAQVLANSASYGTH